MTITILITKPTEFTFQPGHFIEKKKKKQKRSNPIIQLLLKASIKRFQLHLFWRGGITSLVTLVTKYVATNTQDLAILGVLKKAIINKKFKWGQSQKIYDVFYRRPFASFHVIVKAHLQFLS